MTLEQRRVYLAVVAGILMVAGTAAAMYGMISQRIRVQPPSGAEPSAAQSAAGAPAGPAQRPGAPAIEISAEKLAQRLRDSDGSAEDWALLARSYVHLQRYPDAVAAFSRALEKSPGNAAFVAEQSAARKAAAESAAAR